MIINKLVEKMDLSRFGVTIEETIYSNAFGDAVHRASHPAYSFPIAVKQVRLTPTMPAELAWVEPQVLSKLNHPQIPKLLGALLYPSDSAPEFLVIFTQFYPLGDLSRELTR